MVREVSFRVVMNVRGIVIEVSRRGRVDWDNWFLGVCDEGLGGR